MSHGLALHSSVTEMNSCLHRATTIACKLGDPVMISGHESYGTGVNMQADDCSLLCQLCASANVKVANLISS